MKLKKLGIICALLGLGGSLAAGSFTQVASAVTVPVTANSSSLRNVMYYGDWSTADSQGNYNPKDIPAEQLTHINFAFLDLDAEGNLIFTDTYAAVADSVGENIVDGGANAGMLNALQVLRQRNKNVKIGVSIGGWTKSRDFSPMAKDPVARARFVENVTNFVKYTGLDFVDVDWEYPGDVRQPDLVDSLKDEGTPLADPEVDKDNYIVLLSEMRESLNGLSAETGKYYEMSVALPAGAAKVNVGIDVEALFNIVDFANIMTYDYVGAWHQVTAHHSPLYANPADPYANWGMNIHDTVNMYRGKGAPDEKIVIGAAFYSRGWHQVAKPEAATVEDVPAEESTLENEVTEESTVTSEVATEETTDDSETATEEPTVESEAATQESEAPAVVEAPLPAAPVAEVSATPGLYQETIVSNQSGDGSWTRGAKNELPLVVGDGGHAGGIWSFRNIDRLLAETPGLTEYWDDTSKAAYLYSEETGEFFTFENARSVYEKGLYAKTNGLGGVISWMQSQDKASVAGSEKRDTLTTAINQGLFGGAALPEQEIITTPLDLSWEMKKIDGEDHSYQVTIRNNEVLSATDEVVAAVEASFKTVKNPNLYLPFEGTVSKETQLSKIASTTVDLKAVLPDGMLAPGAEVTFDLVTPTEVTPDDLTGVTLVQQVYPDNTEALYPQQFAKIAVIDETTPPTPEIKTGTVVVNYQDTDGKALMDPVTLEGDVGKAYEAEKKAIKGYTFKEVKTGALTGTFTEEQQQVLLVYTKDKAAAAEQESGKRPNLPSTGENSQGILIWSGSLILLAAAGIWFKKRKA